MNWLCGCGQTNSWFHTHCQSCHHRKGFPVWKVGSNGTTQFFVWNKETEDEGIPRLDFALTVGYILLLLPYLLLMIANSARPSYRYEGGKAWFEK